MMEEQRQSLLQKIESAFTNIPRPVYTTKRVARALDDHWKLTPEEWQTCYEQDAEGDWREVSDEDLKIYQDIFAFLEADGVLFYAPAYISHAIRTNDQGYCWSLISAICRNSLGKLSAQQRECVLDFLEFYRAHSQGLEDELVDFATNVVNGCPHDISYDQFLIKQIECPPTSGPLRG